MILKMTYKLALAFALLGCTLSLLFVSCREAPMAKTPEKPNIIVILADDMGYSDLGCMGSEIQTPNLDGLANNGLLFTNCYNASRCCPSRASLLTGLYQHRAGVGFMNGDMGTPSYQGYLNDKCVTIAEMLKEEGYRTIVSGKWHVGSAKDQWPEHRGFDQSYGLPTGGGVYFYPSKFVNRPIVKNGKEVVPDSTTFYSTDNFTKEAIEFIGEGKTNEAPFFLYLPYIAPHFPLQAWPEDIAKYKGKYDEGYNTIRKRRFEKQQKLGVVGDFAISPPDFEPWPSEKAIEEARRMEVYAAQVDRLDQNIGKLVTHLKEIGEWENTVIMFLSDNGASAEVFDRAPGAEVGTNDSFKSYGKAWANVSNTPFRKSKMYEHEGGIGTPLIVHWPKGIEHDGQLVKSPVHITDIMPTCLDIAGATYPKKYNGKTIDPLDGKSFSAILNGKKPEKPRTLFWEHMGNKAVRIGDWKAVKLLEGVWELYNLNEDPTELSDLANNEPDRLKKMVAQWNAWADEVEVRPWPLAGR